MTAALLPDEPGWFTGFPLPSQTAADQAAQEKRAQGFETKVEPEPGGYVVRWRQTEEGNDVSELTAEQKQAKQAEFIERLHVFARDKGIDENLMPVLELVAVGKSYKVISHELGITQYAAKKRVGQIKERLGFSDKMPQYLFFVWIVVRFGNESPSERSMEIVDQLIEFKEVKIS